jgi:flagellar biogenesis protein FliO
MNKILAKLLGVYCWANTVACYAADKFEVLPDLPDPLAYAVQPASAASVSGNLGDSASFGAQSVGHEPSIISVVLSLIFVVLLIYLTGILYAKLNRVGFKTLKKQQGDFAKSHVSVISTTQLGSNKSLHVVELDGKRMLIGASAGAIQLIKDLGKVNSIDDEDEYSHIEIPNIKIPKIEIPKIEIPSIGFSKLVTKAHNETAETIMEQADEDIDEEIPKETDTTENQEQQNPEEIISSLFESQNIQPQTQPTQSEHVVDPDEYALYKKYLG